MVEISRKFDSIRFDSIRLALYFVFAYCFSAGLQAMRKMGFVAQVEKSRYDPYPRRSYATAGTATVVGHPSCVNRLSKATRTCNSVT